MREDPEKTNFSVKKEKKAKENKDDADYQTFTIFKKTQHINVFSFSSGNKILTRRQAEAIFCISLRREIECMEEVRWEYQLFPP